MRRLSSGGLSVGRGIFHSTGSGSGTGMTTAKTTALLIHDVTLVDVVRGRVDGPRSVVIEDGLIRDMLAVAPAWSGTSASTGAGVTWRRG